MHLSISHDCIMAIIGITIKATIFACVICSNINASNTTTFWPLILIFSYSKFAFSYPFKTFSINAVSLCYSKSSKFDCLRTGIYIETILFCDFRKPLHQFYLLLF